MTDALFTEEDCGCIFDHSALSARSLNERTVAFANQYNAQIEVDDDTDPTVTPEIAEENWSNAGDDALDFLNSLCADEVYFTFEDNCLFLLRREEE